MYFWRVRLRIFYIKHFFLFTDFTKPESAIDFFLTHFIFVDCKILKHCIVFKFKVSTRGFKDRLVLICVVIMSLETKKK